MMLRRVLLACGVASTALYALADLLGGLSYPGYDFSSQAISELTAIGAPSRPLVVGLLFLYNVLVLLFGLGVLREAIAGPRLPLRITAGLLLVYAILGLAIGLFWSASFSMQQRGAGSLTTDAPHIIITAVMVLLLLGAIATGSFGFDRRFRLYSFATIVTVLVFGAWTSRFAPRIAAGEATPGLGILERIDVYTAMLWIAVLGGKLSRRLGPRVTLTARIAV
jgi:hypothetical membrane protein